MTATAAHDLSRSLDQFYTNPAYAQDFLSKIHQYVDLSSADILLEPSAGSGAFYNLLDPTRRVGLDLDPQGPGIIQQDFFTYKPDTGKTVITVGNPPFGKNASLAVKFFNHAAEFSDVIAFIIPRTFRKASLVNRLHKNFHLVYDETVPDNSFLFKGEAYDVWCCAQIWVKKPAQRARIPQVKLSEIKHWFEIVEPGCSDFAIQRVGGQAGQIREDDRLDYSASSHYFIKSHDPRVLDVFKQVNFDGVKFNTAGNPSVSASELVELFVEAANNKGISIDLSKPPLPVIFEYDNLG